MRENEGNIPAGRKEIKNSFQDEAAGQRTRHLRQLANEGPLHFWGEMSKEISWFKSWDKILDDRKAPFYRWFINGTLNASYNCIDRHLSGERKNKAAVIFEGEPGDTRVLTYQQLHDEVNKLAAGLKGLGIRKGDLVSIYLPMIPEAIIAMLACARLGAIHSAVFGGFSPEALKERIQEAGSKLLITADGSYRRGKVVPLKENADLALKDHSCPKIEKVVVVQRTKEAVRMEPGRDLWYADLLEKASADCPPEVMDAEDPLFILYSSGTTAKPKGILHTHGGYLVGVHTTFKYIFDCREEDIYWCTADIGWITGHSYLVYGPLSNGATILLYEGTPDYPSRDRFWAMIEKYGVNIFYTAPTAIKMFMRWGEKLPAAHDLSSLRLLGSVGEPINPDAWMWYFKHIGREKCPIMDTWWQTETGMIVLSPLPGDDSFKPGAAARAFPGVEVDVLNLEGKPVQAEEDGYLVITSPWPAMLRTLHKTPERYLNAYWSQYEGKYFSGDGAKKDQDGDIWVTGRVDDLINVSGHRIGTAEIESALAVHDAVAEAAVIGRKHEIKGQAISAFILLKEGFEGSEELKVQLKELVSRRIGAMARPEEIFFAADLPKTHSGKIMRRLLRDIAEGNIIGDTTTLVDPEVIAAITKKI